MKKKEVKIKVFIGDPLETPPKLSYNSLPALKRAAALSPGLATPPFHIPGGVPFLWEEAPGKPRLRSYNVDAKLDGGETPSPTTVLDGPYALRRPPRDFCHSFSAGDEKVLEKVRRAKGEEKKMRSVKSWWKVSRSASAGVSPAASFSSSHHWEEGEETDGVRITRLRRSRNYAGVYTNTATRIWASIKGSLKQVILWQKD